jgi:hypothetical protein
MAVIADTDTREVDLSCVNVHKQGRGREGATVFTNTDTKEVDPSCVDAHKLGENGVDAGEFEPRAFEGALLVVGHCTSTACTSPSRGNHQHRACKRG